ncbi:MAG TPA: AraC family transcriptional regulator [Flavobacteriaceae bacterium]|nr:AraC family transcriptional regulator [Flavobacteriaceae bacterium]
MIYIYFIASFNAFFFLALLLQKKAKQLHDRILIYWLLYLGIATATYALSIDFFPESHLLASGIIALFLLHGPFLYLYVSALTLNQKKFKSKRLWHFIPFVGFVLYLLIASNFPSYSEGIRVDHLTEGVAEPPVLFNFFLIITALSGPIYFYLAYDKFRQNQYSPEFSDKEENLEWLKKLIPIFGIVWTVLIIIAVIHHVFHLFSMEFCTNGLFLSLSVFIILIGYFGLKQKEVFINYATEEPEKEVPEEPEIKYAATKMEGEELQKCCNIVGSYMKANKPYLESDLTLPKLAEELDLSTHHLSQVINEMHGKNFFNFINKYRVAEVKRKIQDPEFQNYSLLGIAYESGFNSKSAFNRVFKNVTGMTPSEYRRSLSSS